MSENGTPPATPAPDARLMNAYPTRADEVEWDVVDDRAVVAVPKPYSRVERWLTRVIPGPDVVFLTLDALGTHAWLAADGSRTVRAVAARLAETFGADAEPADARAAAFFTDLATRRFVRLFEAPRPARDPLRGFPHERGYRSLACRKCERTHPMRAPAGARYRCPRCHAVNKVP